MKTSNIKVYCRIRPPKKETKIDVLVNENTIIYKNKEDVNTSSAFIHSRRLSTSRRRRSSTSTSSFSYDKIFNPSEQKELFETIGVDMISSLFSCIPSTLFAFGNTGTGKTFSMLGAQVSSSKGHSDNYTWQYGEFRGLIPRILEQIYNKKKDTQNVKISIVEVYNEKVLDLQNNSNQIIVIDGVNSSKIILKDVREVVPDNYQIAIKFIQDANLNRHVNETDANKYSSRSHMIITITLDDLKTGTETTLRLIDMAGSESLSQTNAKGETLKQAKYVNRSLTTFIRVINCLHNKEAYIPLRDSVLTRITGASLTSGDTRILLCVSGGKKLKSSETVKTLKFGQDAQNIKVKVKVEKPKTKKQLEKRIKTLEHKIEDRNRLLIAYEDRYGTPKLANMSPKSRRNYSFTESDIAAILSYTETDFGKNEKTIETPTEDESPALHVIEETIKTRTPTPEDMKVIHHHHPPVIIREPSFEEKEEIRPHHTRVHTEPVLFTLDGIQKLSKIDFHPIDQEEEDEEITEILSVHEPRSLEIIESDIVRQLKMEIEQTKQALKRQEDLRIEAENNERILLEQQEENQLQIQNKDNEIPPEINQDWNIALLIAGIIAVFVAIVLFIMLKMKVLPEIIPIVSNVNLVLIGTTLIIVSQLM
jgi:hypothetical protein